MALKLKTRRSANAPAPAPRQFKAIILNSVFSDWSQDDTILSEECLTRMKRGLSVVGIESEVVQVKRDIASPLRKFDPREYVVFNWAEG
ncbi:MAG: hypothetical protein JNL09_06030, partial [Anaerolineales bacterium]|nr:hypothetical protein [Anaerolineales bacterium]